MRLLCSEIIHTLRYKPILISSLPDGHPIAVEASDKSRQRHLNPLISKIQQANKIIFDSGSDQDPRTTEAVKVTAVNMLEAKLFHQPYPICFIEDPYSDDPDGQRNFYLTIEKEKSITVWFFQKLNIARHFGRMMGGKNFPDLAFHPYPLVIDLVDAKDEFRVMGGPAGEALGVNAMYGKILAESIYAFKKLIVTLNTENHIHEKVRAASAKGWKGDPRNKPYDHTIIRIPSEDDLGDEPGDGSGTRIYTGRRKHLVRGYLRNRSKPLEQQTWVKPYWRGNSDIGTVERDYYEVR